MDHQMDYPSIQTLILPILNANCGIISRYGNLHLILPVIFSSILQKVRSDFNTVCRPAQIGISLIRSTASNLISGTKASVSAEGAPKEHECTKASVSAEGAPKEHEFECESRLAWVSQCEFRRCAEGACVRARLTRKLAFSSHPPPPTSLVSFYNNYIFINFNVICQAQRAIKQICQPFLTN
jgi:hypothetical protein